MAKHVAVDLGAESGRVIVGDCTAIEVVHRFANGPVTVGCSLYWDILGIFREVKAGLRKAFQAGGTGIRSIGVDTWGVDYALLDRSGDLIANPYHYRDARTEGVMEQVFRVVPWPQIHAEAGTQRVRIATLYQLFAHRAAKPWLVEQAHRLLMIPDLLHYWLCGVAANEYTIATTSQLYSHRANDWAWPLIDRLGFPRGLFGRLVMPGTVLGPLLPAVADEIGAPPDVQVVAPACHDTASAVAAAPCPEGPGHAWLSSGTWSLLGVDAARMLAGSRTLAHDLSNEGGADGKVRLLKNILGLWILQECRRAWAEQGRDLPYAEIAELADRDGPARFAIDVNDDRFIAPNRPGDAMPDRIRAWCRETGQPVPETPAGMARGILESLAARYARSIRELEEVTGECIVDLYVIGGGSRNALLCRLTAEACGIPVHAGPVEATALGNLLVQAIGLGEIRSMAEGRARVRDANRLEEYRPG